MSVTSYEFKALTSTGEVQRGITRAETWNEAFRKVSISGLTPVKIKKARIGRFSGKLHRKISLRDLSLFTYQFSILMDARMPVAEGLRSIAEEETVVALRTMVLELAASIEAGSTITEAMLQYKHVFGDVYIETIHAAERSGNMVSVLLDLSRMLGREVERSSALRSAMIYPMCVIIALIAAVTFLMMFIVPRFAGMFSEREIPLPLATRLLLGMSGFLTSYWWILLPVIITTCMLFAHVSKLPQGRILLDRYLHKLPFIKTALQATALARFAHVLGLSMSSGLSLIDCIEMSGRSSGRPMLITDANKMAAQVAQGGSLAEVMSSCSYIPRFVRRLLLAGEQSAQIPRMCTIIAKHYDREVEYLTKNIATIIEPVLVIVLAGVVLFMALAIFLPMWNMMSLMG